MIDRILSGFLIAVWFIFSPIIILLVAIVGWIRFNLDFFKDELPDLYKIYTYHNGEFIKLWKTCVLKKYKEDK